MRRREFIAGLGLTAAMPFTARGQQSGRMRRVAWLGLGRSDPQSPYVEALRTGLRELGWIEGRNLTLGLYWATGRNDMTAAGQQLLRDQPEVVVTQELMTYAMR